MSLIEFDLIFGMNENELQKSIEAIHHAQSIPLSPNYFANYICGVMEANFPHRNWNSTVTAINAGVPPLPNLGYYLACSINGIRIFLYQPLQELQHGGNIQ